MNEPRFDGRIDFLERLMPLVLLIDRLFGRGEGDRKKKALTRLLRTNVDISLNYGTRHSLDPQVKKLRDLMIERVVQNIKWNGVTEGTDLQRLKAGIGLRYLAPETLAAFEKDAKKQALTTAEKALLTTFYAKLPPSLVEAPDPRTVPAAKRPRK